MSAAPIYLEPYPITPEIRVTEAALQMLEGALTVRGVQYATPSDADLARRHEAERLVAQTERLARLAGPCAWCELPIAPGAPTVEVGGRRLHVERCNAEFARFTYDVSVH